MGLREEILALAQHHAGMDVSQIERGALFGPGGLDGDDADEFIDAYAATFDVNLADFRDYFHYDVDEPPTGRRVVPIDATGSEIPYLPVSLDHLVAAAARGRWEYPYPVHTVQNRWWVRLYPLLLMLVLAGLVALIFAILR